MPAHPSPAAPSRPRKRPQSTLLARSWWIAPVAIALIAGVLLYRRAAHEPGSSSLAGYLVDVELLRTEYSRFYDHDLANPDLETKFRAANAAMLRHDYASAAALLEDVQAQAAVPAVLNNLGVLYAEMNDRARALNSFRDALARDAAYQAVRSNLERLKHLTADSGDPVTEEIEPNGTLASANLIAPGKPVEAEIEANRNDEDTFRFTVPPPPRDVLALKVSNQSGELIPGMRVYDANQRLTEPGRGLLEPGSSITRYISLPPQTTIFLQVWGARGTGGKYNLTVESTKAFDAFEPNDDIFNARRLEIGSPADANIMDSNDTDYYQFTAPRDGLVLVEIRNRSTTLIPALTTFSPDRRNSGFGPDVRTAGAGMTHRMEVQRNQIYFLQVWPQGDSSGIYTLRVE